MLALPKLSRGGSKDQAESIPVVSTPYCFSGNGALW
jgi:hypothetical protein